MAQGTAPVVPLAPGQLFNGKDLGNWDGDPAVWRVRGLLFQRTGDCATARNWAMRAEALLEAAGEFARGFLAPWLG